MLGRVPGREVPEELAALLRYAAGEIHLVRWGLDDTMLNAYNTIRELMAAPRDVPDLRTTAFVVAIEKIADACLEMGLS